MTTRHASADAPLHDNRYMSDLEFVEMRGIGGTAVATKAAYLSDPKQRALLFFIQSLSIEQQGTKRLAVELVEMFADEIGTPSMLKFGMKPGQIYNADQVRVVRVEIPRSKEELEESERAERQDRTRDSYAALCEGGWRGRELSGYGGRFRIKGECVIVRTDTSRECQQAADREDAAENKRAQAEAAKFPENYPASVFVELCREHVAARLPEFLVELCINPRVELRGEDDASNPDKRERVQDDNPGIKGDEFKPASMPCFPTVLTALFEYQRRYEERARQAFAMTSIGKQVFAALDYAAKTGRMVLVQGPSGVGKTASVRTWWTLNRGRALHVQLTGINKSRAFFGAIAKAAGLPCTASLSPEKMQFRVERFLESSRLLLLIDEGQYLWPQGVRVRCHPELVNWLNTACANKGVPVAIVATEEFTTQRRRIEDQTAWPSFQLRRRLRRVFPLPDKPTKDDLAMVARKLLADGTDAMINFIVGYALACSGHMQAVVDAIDDARLLALDAGRERITAADIKKAITEIRGPSDAAQKRVFAPAEKRGRQPQFRAAAADLPPHPRSIPAGDILSDESSSKNRLNGDELVET